MEEDQNISSDEEKKTGFFKVSPGARLRGYFITGVIVSAPIAITIYLTVSFVGYVDSTIGQFIPDRYNPENFLPFSIPGLGLLVILVGLTLLGALTANLFGQSLIHFGERIVERMPIIRGIYATLKQVTETILSDQSQSFQEAVLIEYPRKGTRTIGFVTGRTKGEVQRKLGRDDLINVYVPTTPNPTSGFMLFVPKEELIYLDMSVEEAIKMVISTGLVTPPEKNQDQAVLPLTGR